MLKKYSVQLGATAYVIQHQHDIEANSAAEAEKLALARYNDEIWEYDGLTSHDPAVIEVREEA